MRKSNGQRERRTFYRIDRIAGRWTIVAPDGKPFISLGVVHLGAMAAFHETDGRDRGATLGRLLPDLRGLGFNTAGYHHPPEIQDHLPFIADTYLAWIPYSAPQPKYPDVFGGYGRGIRPLVRRMCAAVKLNTNLIGYYWTNTPRWDLDTARRLTGDDWVSAIRRMPAGFPGKKEYVAYLCERYRSDPETFRARYGFNLDDRSLLDMDFSHLQHEDPIVHRDDYEFLRLIARAYYRAAGEAMEREDRRHLVFGDRYMLSDMPIEVLEEALPWIDVVAVQPHEVQFEKERFDRIYEIARKPILICDHAINFPTGQYPKTGWPNCTSEADAAANYARYLSQAFATSYVVGYHRCHYMDHFSRSHRVLMQGLVREDGTPYRILVEAVRGANHAVLGGVLSKADGLNVTGRL